jgi:hypothetical protein
MTCDPVARVFAPGGRRLEGSSLRRPSRIRATRLALVPAVAAVTAALTACGTGSSSTAGPSAGPAAASAAAASAASASPAPAATGPLATATATAGAPVPAGGPALAGFAATSVTFVSTDQAFVLGTAECAHARCTAIAATPNRGATWERLPAPAVPLGDPLANSGQAAVWGIRFAGQEQGFVFGNGLWATTDGGERWTASASPGGSIDDLEVIDGQVLALSYACSAKSGCGQTGALYRRALAGGPWSLVTQVSGAPVIATQARVAAVVDDGGRVMVTGDGGLTFAVRATPCAGSGSAGSAVAVTGPDSLGLLCAGGAAAGSVQKTVYVSDDLGATWSKAGSPPFAGDPWGISAGTPARLTVAAVSGATWLYYSADGGVQWTIAYRAPFDGGVEFNDLGFTTTADGVAVLGPVYSDANPYGMPGELLLTSDGGASWTSVRI